MFCFGNRLYLNLIFIFGKLIYFNQKLSWQQATRMITFFFAPTEALYANWTKTVTPNQNSQQTNEQKNHANYAFEVPWKCDNITLQKFVLRLSTQLHDADAAISFVVVQKISAASCFSGSQRQTEAWETSLSILCLHPMPAAFFCHKCFSSWCEKTKV